MLKAVFLLGKYLRIGQRKDWLVKPGVNKEAKPEAGQAQ